MRWTAAALSSRAERERMLARSRGTLCWTFHCHPERSASERSRAVEGPCVAYVGTAAEFELALSKRSASKGLSGRAQLGDACSTKTELSSRAERERTLARSRGTLCHLGLGKNPVGTAAPLSSRAQRERMLERSRGTLCLTSHCHPERSASERSRAVEGPCVAPVGTAAPLSSRAQSRDLV